MVATKMLAISNLFATGLGILYMNAIYAILSTNPFESLWIRGKLVGTVMFGLACASSTQVLLSLIGGWNVGFFISLLAVTIFAVLTKIIPWVWYIYSLGTPTAEAGCAGRYRPMFFFAKTIHTRFHPTYHTFRYPLLYVGFPITLEGTVSALFSVRGLATNRAQTTSSKGERKQIFSFFDVRPEKFVNPELPFSKKLEPVLKQFGLNPMMYPHIYFVTTPAFLGYAFNPVSYYYLYNSEHELKVLLLEVKNTFGEKHVYMLNKDNATYPFSQNSYDFGGEMEKTFHISPFGHRSGTYQIQVKDPLGKIGGEAFLNVSMRVFDENGKKTMMARAFSTEAGFDLVSASMFKTLRTVIGLGLNTYMAMPFSLFEAWRVFRKGAPVYSRPEPNKGTGQRKATNAEAEMQSLWLQYFKDRILKYPLPIICILTLPQPNATQKAKTEIFESSVTALELRRRQVNCSAEASRLRHNTTLPLTAFLTIEVTNPALFSKFFSNQDPLHTIWMEFTSKAPEKRPAKINNLELFLDILTKSYASDIEVSHASDTVKQPVYGWRWSFVSWVRLWKSGWQLAKTYILRHDTYTKQQIDIKRGKEVPVDSLVPFPTTPPELRPAQTIGTLDAYFLTSRQCSSNAKQEDSDKLYRRMMIQAMMIDFLADGDADFFDRVVLILQTLLWITVMLVMVYLGACLATTGQYFGSKFWVIGLFFIINSRGIMDVIIRSL